LRHLPNANKHVSRSGSVLIYLFTWLEMTKMAKALKYESLTPRQRAIDVTNSIYYLQEAIC